MMGRKGCLGMNEAEKRKPEECLVHRGLGRVEFFDFSSARLDGLQGELDIMAAEGNAVYKEFGKRYVEQFMS